MKWDRKWEVLAYTVIADTLLSEIGTQSQDHSWAPGDNTLLQKVIRLNKT